MKKKKHFFTKYFRCEKKLIPKLTYILPPRVTIIYLIGILKV